MKRRRIGIAAAVLIPTAVVAVLAALLFQGGTPRHRAVYTAPPPGKPVHAAPAGPGPYVGVYEPGTPKSWAPVARFATATGVKPGIALYYSSWWEPFQSRFADAARAHGAIAFAQMIPYGKGVSVRRVITGQYDGYLKTFASQVRRFGHPVILGFAPEMNGDWYPWGWHRLPPALWIKAWQHVVTTFRRQGADNVTWLWTASTGGHGPLRDYWPGASYVNWVGLDGYYYLHRWGFGHVFGQAVAAVRLITADPVLLSETAVGQVAGKAAKIPDMFGGVRQDHLAGLVWFDVTQHRGLYHQNWRLEGDSAAVGAFRRAATALTRHARPAPVSVGRFPRQEAGPS